MESVFYILLIVEAFFLQKVVKKLEKVVASCKRSDEYGG